MKIYLIFFVLLFKFGNEIYGQQIIVRGVISDKLTDEKLPGASIYVKGSGLGIFTNQEGAFELFVPSDMKGDTLVISYIGFKNKYLFLNSYMSNVTVQLEYESRQLPEVSVVADTSYKIVQKALSLIKKNYASKAHYQEAFYRELSMKDSQYVRIIEAAVGIRDKGYFSENENRKLKIISIRKSEDYIEKSITSRIVEKVFGGENRNTLISTLNFADFIRSYHSKKYLLEGHGKKNLTENYAFKLKEVTSYNNEKVFIINFVFPADRRRSDVFGEIIINASDYGILKFSYKFGDSVDRLKPTNKYWRPAFNSIYLEYIAQYRKINNKYYLNKVSGIYPINFAGLKDGGTTGYQFYYNDLVINDTFLKRKDFERVKYRQKLKNDISLYDKDFESDPDFWKTYNKTIIDGSINKAKQDLELLKNGNQ